MCHLWSSRKWFHQSFVAKFPPNECHSSLWPSVVSLIQYVIFITQWSFPVARSNCLSPINQPCLLPRSCNSCIERELSRKRVRFTAYESLLYPLTIPLPVKYVLTFFFLLALAVVLTIKNFHRSFLVLFVAIPSRKLPYPREPWMMFCAKRIHRGVAELWRFLIKCNRILKI